MNKVAVVGVHQTRFDEHWDKSLRDLAREASLGAISDAGLDNSDIKSLYVGNMSGGRFVGQEHIAALIADHAGMNPIPAVRCEAACASGALAFREAYLAVASGKYDIVMALGVEKMTDLKTQDVITSLMGAGDQEWEASIGLTFAGLYALMARAHMNKFGTTQEQLALVSVNNHKNAVGSPFAQFPFEITVKDVLASPIIADPLHLLDCSPISDGASAVILVTEKLAKTFAKPAWVLASEQATDTLALHDRKSLVEMLSTKIAAKKAYDEAGIQPKNIDVLEVHDCFSINEILCIEDLGFCEKGKGGAFVEAGKISKNGEIPVNTTGGLKAGGHPVGATGIRQIADLVKMIRGECYNRLSVNNGLALNIGGSGATANINILGRELKV